ncbi:type VI secretion system baseplate subunit TssG [Thalassomonas actiniarum]|uniref:Type VI secretion system baseplate subunit TssG n=1 Tax=Thalassomonas actiniarum TaxID=485447 RepID=A0AAF0C1M2_9GAMM|nr:type VI secretion system baseplate subunit TssG [Thalassomonas actiniarum]WDD99156.1 type VI secretion system baseplate subunit TssG [Thalassomonas actiniarum]
MSIVQQALSRPEQFDLVQLIRIINRYTQTAQQPFELVLEADPMPNNRYASISDFSVSGSQAKITSCETSLSSGNAVVPVYIYEELLKAFHNEEYALYDFLNIFNDRYFHLYARTVEKSYLLLTEESDRFFARDRHNATRQQEQLVDCIAALSGLPAGEQTKKWLGYGLMLGMPNRSRHQLQQVLQDYFALTLSVRSKALSKHQLTEESWTRIGGAKPQNNQLGQGFLLGQRCYLAQQRLIITIEPENANQLAQLYQDNLWYLEMADMARCYLRDKTEIEIYLKAPDNWFKRMALSPVPGESVRLGMGFHIKSSQQHHAVVYLIHLVKD